MITGSSVGAIAAPIWLDHIIAHISAHSYAVVLDSLVINMPESYQPEFFSLWGFCNSILVPSDYVDDCHLRNFSHVDIHILAMRKHPLVPFITVTSKYDNVATAAYSRFVEDKGNAHVWPQEYHNVMISVLERLNKESNFLVYMVTSINHLFLTRDRFYDATQYGDKDNMNNSTNGI